MRKYARIALWTALVVGVIVGGLRATVLEWTIIPEDDAAMTLSLAPNLEGGDRVLLWRTGIEVGDLVRCTDPDEPRRFVFGRVLAKGLETIEVHGQDLKVDGKAPTQETNCTVPRVEVMSPSGEPTTLSCGQEAFRGAKYQRLVTPNAQPSYGARAIPVPAGKYFLVSDNRVYPMDSREYGSVPVESCKGTVFFRLWSKKGFGDADKRFTYIH